MVVETCTNLLGCWQPHALHVKQNRECTARSARLTNIGKRTGDVPELRQLCELLDAHFSERLLPDQLMGWLILHRAGLTAQERSAILG